MAWDIYTALQVICAVLTYLSVIRLIQYDRLSKEYKILIITLCFIFMYNVCTAFEVYVQSKEAALISIKLRTLCIGQILLHMFQFVRYYCKIKVPKWIPYLYGAINIILVTTVFFSDRGRKSEEC